MIFEPSTFFKSKMILKSGNESYPKTLEAYISCRISIIKILFCPFFHQYFRNHFQQVIHFKKCRISYGFPLYDIYDIWELKQQWFWFTSLFKTFSLHDIYESTTGPIAWEKPVHFHFIPKMRPNSTINKNFNDMSPGWHT